MTAFLLALALFAGFSVVGLAVLAGVRADTASLRVALTAPALGSAVAALATFVFSHAGMATYSFGRPLAIALLAVAVGTLAWRRPRLHRGVLAVAAVSVIGLLLAATPMFSFGLHWLANANDDMANYSLSAQQLLHHGLAAPINFGGLLGGRDYPTVLTTLQAQGTRPGSDLTIAFVAAITGVAPYAIFMPLIFALAMTGICATGALAACSKRPWWVAALAATLLAISPMATFGALQQLIAQVFGLTLATALLALLMRRNLHNERIDARSELVPIGLLLAGVILVYIELASTLALIYALYLAALAVRRQLTLRLLLKLWLGSALVVVVVLNTYLFKELGFLRGQVTHGTAVSANPPLFGYMLVPSALAVALGLQSIGGSAPGASLLGVSILAAAGFWIVTAATSARALLKGSAIGAILVGDSLLAVYLALHGADFGLLKLAMYAQPFVAAAIAVCLAGARRRYAPVVAVALALFALVEISTQQVYVSESRNPVDLYDASVADLVPLFAALARRSREPVVSVGANPFLLKLEAIAGYDHPLYFLSRDLFTPFVATEEKRLANGHAPISRLARADAPRSAQLRAPRAGRVVDSFTVSPQAERALASGRCTLVLPTRQQEPFNGRQLPAGQTDLASMSCAAPRNLLAFVTSNRGQSFYLPLSYSAVSFYPFEGDYFFPGQNLVGFGQYALFQVLGPTPAMRMVLSYTLTLRHDGSNKIPPSTVLGASRYAFPSIGRDPLSPLASPHSPDDRRPPLPTPQPGRPRIRHP